MVPLYRNGALQHHFIVSQDSHQLAMALLMVFQHAIWSFIGRMWRHCCPGPSFDRLVQWSHVIVGRVPAVE